MSPVQYVNQGWNGLVCMQRASGVVDGRNVFQDWDLAAWFPSQFMEAVGMSTGHSREGFPSHPQGQPFLRMNCSGCLIPLPARRLPQGDAGEMPEGLRFGSGGRDVPDS